MPSTKPRLLILGATGFVGSRWAMAAEPRFEVWRGSRSAVAMNRSAVVDISDANSVRAVFDRVQPEFVTHLAALSDIDRCERERDLAERVNVEGAVNVAAACAECGARMLFTSTGAVFDGTKGMYHELDPPTPLSWYGKTKALAEKEILRPLPTATIVRFSLVLGCSALGRGNSYLDKVIDSGRAGKQIVSPTYEFRNPIDVATLCQYLLELTPRADASGIFHVGASDKMSRYELARAIAARLGVDFSLIVPQDAAIPGRAPRGRDDFLASGRLPKYCRTPVPTCQQVIERAVDGIA